MCSSNFLIDIYACLTLNQYFKYNLEYQLLKAITVQVTRHMYMDGGKKYYAHILSVATAIQKGLAGAAQPYITSTLSPPTHVHQLFPGVAVPVSSCFLANT